MTKRNNIPLYSGKVTARKVGAFMKDGFAFDVVRPGVDIQGRNRIAWTQVVWNGTPIWETKMNCDLPTAMTNFSAQWAELLGAKTEFAQKMLELEAADRNERFQDGVSGVEVAASHEDGPVDKKYPG